MKKIIVLLLAFILLFSFCNCSGEKYSENAITAAQDAIQISELYIEGKVNCDYASREIKSIGDELSEYILENQDLPTTENDKWINGKIGFLFDEDVEELKENISDLQKMIE